MQTHPDLEELFKTPQGSEVVSHLQSCDICRQIVEDAQLLAAELNELSYIAPISENVESQIRQNISLQAKAVRRQIFRKNLLVSLSAIAAILVLVIGVFNWQADSYIKTADVNKDGEVNVLDSFLLAKKLANNEGLDIGDLNHNGKISDEDLIILREQIVSLESELR